jgi:plasmid maintenance system antidote protein VapI
MNRFDKKSKTKFSNNRIFAKTKINNEIIRDLTRTKIKDVTNTNKAFKKEIILPLLQNTETEAYYWLEIATMHDHWMQYKTHYIQEKIEEKSNSLKTLKELSIIKKKQEN